MVRAPLSAHSTLDASGRILYAAQADSADLIAVDTTTGDVRTSSARAFDDHDFKDQDLGVALVDDRLVAVGAGDRVHFYDRETLAPTRTIPLEGDVASLDIVADGQGGIVTTGWEGTTRVDVATGQILLAPLRRSDPKLREPAPRYGHDARVRVLRGSRPHRSRDGRDEGRTGRAPSGRVSEVRNDR